MSRITGGLGLGDTLGLIETDGDTDGLMDGLRLIEGLTLGLMDGLKLGDTLGLKEGL